MAGQCPSKSEVNRTQKPPQVNAFCEDFQNKMRLLWEIASCSWLGARLLRTNQPALIHFDARATYHYIHPWIIESLKLPKERYIGHLKERSLKDQMRKDPTEVIRKAVFRMLPKNRLRDDRARKLRIFVGDQHPFADKPLQPFEMPPRNVREFRPRERRAAERAQKKAANEAKLALLREGNNKQ